MYQPKENIWDIEYNLNYEKVTDYVTEKRKKFNNINIALKNIKEVFNSYLSLTKSYSEEIQLLALRLKPLANTIEGDLTQAIQSVLLFNSDSLETFVKEMNNFFEDSKKKEDFCHYEFEEFCKVYHPALSELFNNYCIYIEEMEKYERYLMNKEMGFNNINEKSKKNEKIVSKDNIESVLEKRKKYVEKIEPLNHLIDKLVELGVKEEELINEEFYNISKMFVNKLNECVEIQKGNYQVQSSVLDELYKIIKSEQLENFNSGIQQYSLHCLSIYINSKNLKNKKKGEKFLNQKNKDFEIYKNITLENIDNIIKEMKKNGLEIKEKDLKDLEREKIKVYIEEKANIICGNIKGDFIEEDKNKIIKYIKEDNDYLLFFLQILNNERVKGGLILDKNIFNYTGEIFKILNDIILETQLIYFKNVMIISMTYYTKEDEDKRKYIFEFIKDNENFKDIKFWEKYLQIVIDIDIKSDIKKEEDIIEDKEKFKKNFTAFSNIITTVNNMINFQLDETLINEFITLAIQKYSLTKQQIKQIKESLPIFFSNNKKYRK